MNFIPNETATPIRYPSTANLMIDSADRTTFFSSPWDFQISKPNSIMNGFFTRIGTTEVVLDWCEPNISADLSSNILIVDISGGPSADVYLQPITFPTGFYTVEELLDEFVVQLNDLSGSTGVSNFAVSIGAGGTVSISAPGIDVGISQTTVLSTALVIPTVTANTLDVSFKITNCADLRPYKYLDFVSSQLTYNQELKDNSTANFARDVLCRWYMAWDVEPQYDAYGYPILMGYKKFIVRRLFNPPKQIKWSANQPLGNISFQVFGNDGNLLTSASDSDWLMTLQVSEV